MAHSALIVEAALFNHPAGALVVEMVAHGDELQAQLRKTVTEDRLGGLGHVAFAPLLLTQDVAQLPAVGHAGAALILMQADGAAGPARLFGDDGPDVLLLVAMNPALQDGFGFLHALVGLPSGIGAHVGILGVGIHVRRVLQPPGAKDQALCFKGLHRSSSLG